MTIEALAQYVWGELAPSLAASPVRRLRVEVEETSGQSAAYEADLAVFSSGTVLIVQLLRN